MSRKPPQSLPRLPGVDEIVPTIKAHIEADRALKDKIIETVHSNSASFANVLKPLVELENRDSGKLAVIAGLKYCSPDVRCQDAAEEAEKILQEYESQKRPQLYDLLKVIKDQGEQLDREDQKLLDRKLLSFEGEGYGILNDEQMKFRQERSNKIHELETLINRNLRESHGGEYLWPSEVDGVPDNKRGEKNNEGKEFYGFDNGASSVIKHAHNREVRKRMTLARNADGAENVPIFRDVLLLRDENARELGHSCHAETKIPYKTAESVEWIMEFLAKTAEALQPLGREDLDRIKALQHRDLSENPEKAQGQSKEFMQWDFAYYSNLDEMQNKVDHGAISEYFPLRHTFDAMLGIFAHCLQLDFRPIPEDIAREYVWHEDVRAWEVWDDRPETKGEFVGYLYADLTKRPHKYKGAQSVNFQAASSSLLNGLNRTNGFQGYVQPNGERVYPANCVMCNVGQDSPDTGNILTHHNVTTLFHELGHSMHDLVARTKHARHHGYNVSTEFGEGIGITMEHWCWLPKELQKISKHYTRVSPRYREAWEKAHPGQELPPEKIPDELIQSRTNRRPWAKANKILGFVMYSAYDMGLHSQPTRDALVNLDMAELWRDVFEKYRFRRLQGSIDNSLVDGLFVSGYEAGYYSYVCAEVFAADLFQTILSKDPYSQEAWQRFRSGILEPGGSRGELEMLEGFLGRPVSQDALMSTLSVVSKSQI